MSNVKTYKNVISLGFYCGPALEIERLGLHNYSFPFDWLITSDFAKVIELVESGFEGFLVYDNLFQEKNVDYRYYYDNVNSIHFYHDFSGKIPLSGQFGYVKEKYQRRIDRFYKEIKSPTIFVRYCSSEKEIDFINENYGRIDNLIKSHNPQNQIYYIIPSNISFNASFANSLVLNKGYKASSNFLNCKNAKDFKNLLLETVEADRRTNLKLHAKKHRKRVLNKIKRRLGKLSMKFFGFALKKKVYLHDKTI